MADKKFEDLRQVVKDGKLLTATRKELERYARIVCLSGFPDAFSAQGPHIGDTVRLMLLVRISEGMSRTALYVSVAALIISLIAAIFAGIGAFR